MEGYIAMHEFWTIGPLHRLELILVRAKTQTIWDLNRTHFVTRECPFAMNSNDFQIDSSK